MLMIPMPLVIALVVAVLLIRELLFAERDKVNAWLVAAVCLFIFQEILVGVRFGYDLEWLRSIQPFSAALLPPLAYLAFKRPSASRKTLIHLLPLLAVIVSLTVLPGALDAILAANNIFYAVALAQLGMRGADALGWVAIRSTRIVQLLLWLVVATLIVSGITDAAIVYDFWKTDGLNTASIAGSATLAAAIAMLGFIFSYRWYSSTNTTPSDAESEKSSATFEKLGALIKAEKLHLDPDINLNRIARRMVLPARDVSRAVNISTGNNVSQYINALRIEEACELLRNTETPITQIVFAVGFNTKSNFNREFARIKQQSPSEWRSDG